MAQGSAVHCRADESVLVQGMPDFALHSAGSSVIGHSALVPGTLQGWQSISYRLHGLFPGFSAPKHPDANKVILQATENEHTWSRWLHCPMMHATCPGKNLQLDGMRRKASDCGTWYCCLAMGCRSQGCALPSADCCREYTAAMKIVAVAIGNLLHMKACRQPYADGRPSTHI